MLVKSPERVRIEEEIDNSFGSLPRQIIGWFFSNLYQKLLFNGAGIWPLSRPDYPTTSFGDIFRLAKLDVSDDVAKKWKNLPAARRYFTAYDELEALDGDEEYLATKHHADKLGAVKNLLTRNAYVVFAGTDLHPASLFERTVFEDIAYGKEWDNHMWWQPDKYQPEALENVVKTLTEAGVLSHSPSIEYITGDSNETRADNDFNNSEWTLMIKGGHSVVNFLQRRFEDSQVNFGAIVVISPADKETTLIEDMAQRGYTKAVYERGEAFYSPFSTFMLHPIHVFLKD